MMAFLQSEPVPEQPAGCIFQLLPPLIEGLAPPLIRAWGRTLRIRFKGLEHIHQARSRGGFLFAIWHGNLLVPMYSHRDRGLICLVSPVWEGELIARGLKGMGYRLIRASSNYESSEGLRSILRALKNGATVVVVVDGPEGPRRKVKQGIAALASISGCPIVTCFGTGQRNLILPSWDRQEIAYPFSRTIIGFSEPIYIPKRLSREQIKKWQKIIERNLHELERDVRFELTLS